MSGARASAWFAIAALVACSGDGPPADLTLATYARTPFTGVTYSLRFDGDALALGPDTARTDARATLTTEGSAQLDAAMRAFERGWDGPYGCGGDCFGGESFLFDSQEGRIWLWQWSEEPRPETAALRAVTDALIREMSGCTGGTLTQQCVVETP